MGGVASAFETKFLFSVGRHFWNFIAVCGFIAMATGGILALDGMGGKYQKERDLRSRLELVPAVEEIPDFDAWIEQRCYQDLKPMRGYSKEMHAQVCGRYVWRVKRAGDKACWPQDWQGKKLGTGKYVEGKCDGHEVKFEFLDGYVNEFRNLYYTRLDENEKAIAKKNEVESRNSGIEAQLTSLQVEKGLKLGLGGVVAAWGLGVVALSALNAALLAIERNTRANTN